MAIVIPRRVPWRQKPPIASAQFNRKWLKSPHGFFLPLSDGAGAPRDVLANRNITIAGGPTWVTTADGYGLSFDEFNDDVRVTDFSYGPNFLVGIELSAADNSGTAFQYFFSHGAVSTQNSINIFLTESSATPESFPDQFIVNFRDGDDADFAQLESTTTWSANTVFRIFVRVNSGGVAIFVNGIKEDSDATHGGGSFNPSGNIFIGARQDLNAARYFGGVINWTLLLDGDYSDAEVKALSEGVPQIFAPRTQRIFIPVGGTKTATFVLNDKDSAAVANATGIRAAWFDQMPGSSMSAPTDVSAIETSDGSGNHTINIPNSTLTSGQTGYYAISNSDGTIATNHLQGGGPAKVD